MRDAYYSEPPSYFGQPVTPWEEELAATLQAIFTAGTHDLEGIVTALNRSPLRPAGREDWTADGFKAVLQNVGW
jgi:hypothetical protein